MKQVILDFLDPNPWNIFLLHIPLFVCALIGCWIATMGLSRPSKFGRTLARGTVGGAVGGFLNPMWFLMFATSVTVGPNRVQALQAMLPILTAGAVLSFPLSILIAARKRRSTPESTTRAETHPAGPTEP